MTTTTTTDDVTHIRALLAEQTARAEKAETLLERAEVAFHAAIARANQVLAANAEMRAALDAVVRDLHDFTIPVSVVEENATEALSRPDLGAGMVVVPKEVLEQVRQIIKDDDYKDDARILADLDALLKKGGG